MIKNMTIFFWILRSISFLILFIFIICEILGVNRLLVVTYLFENIQKLKYNINNKIKNEPEVPNSFGLILKTREMFNQVTQINSVNYITF